MDLCQINLESKRIADNMVEMTTTANDNAAPPGSITIKALICTNATSIETTKISIIDQRPINSVRRYILKNLLGLFDSLSARNVAIKYSQNKANILVIGMKILAIKIIIETG